MDTQTQSFTAEDLLNLPDDGMRYELVAGILKTMEPAGHYHGRLAMRIASSLDHYVHEHDLGAVYAAETGFILATDPDTVRAPDAAFVRQERVDEVGITEGYWPGAPDLAIEVISPCDRYTEVEEKVFDWLDAGTRLVIVVNPRKQTATVYRSFDDIVVLREADVLAADNIVAGWTMPVQAIFE